MRKRVVSGWVAAVLAAALLAGCGNNETTQETEETTEAEGTEESSGVVDTEATGEEEEAAGEAAEEAAEQTVSSGETEYPITITDSYGETITIESEPEKVISVAPNLTEMMFKLDAGDKLVGRSEYCDYPDEALEVESVGSMYYPDIEAIVALEPDLVIVSTHFDDESTEKLEELNIPIITLYEEYDYYGAYDMIAMLGEIVNRNEEAAATIEEMQETVDEVEQTVEGQEEPTVYYVTGYGEYGDFTCGGDTFTGQILTLAGADNIAQDVSGWSITTEEIIEADPEIIILPEYMKDDFMATSPYSELTAVKEGHVYTIDNNLLERQGYRNAEGVRAVAEICYPELFER